MKLSLKRYEWQDKATLGNLQIDDDPFCITLEDVDRFLERYPNAKVAGETAIPRGTYNVSIDYSAHFNRPLPHVLNVPGFEGVRIHSGNSDKDTEGCILVGKDPKNDWISSSRQTFDDLFSKMKEAISGGEEITLEVS